MTSEAGRPEWISNTKYQVRLFGVDLPEAQFNSLEGAQAYVAALRSPSAQVWIRDAGSLVPHLAGKPLHRPRG